MPLLGGVPERGRDVESTLHLLAGRDRSASVMWNPRCTSGGTRHDVEVHVRGKSGTLDDQVGGYPTCIVMVIFWPELGDVCHVQERDVCRVRAG